MLFMKRTHRDLWPSWMVKISVVIRLMHTCITVLFNFQDNLSKWCRAFGRLDTNFQCGKITTADFYTARTKSNFFSLRSLMICCESVWRRQKKIILTMRNFTLQIKIIMRMDVIHMCGFCTTYFVSCLKKIIEKEPERGRDKVRNR